MDPTPLPALPAALRNAGIVGLATLFLASALLVQTGGSELGLDPSGGRPFDARSERGTATLEDLTIPTPQPRDLATTRTRSSAVVTAPEGFGAGDGDVAGPQLPAQGNYVYSVQGTEQSGVLGGSRSYPSEATMSIHRRPGGAVTGLDADEVVIDLVLSGDHRETRVASYNREGISFGFESWSVTFGSSTHSTQAEYDPPLLQIPAPLEQSARKQGTSRANTPDGRAFRVEDWTVSVQGQEDIVVMGETISTWVVRVERQSRPGASETMSRTRTYWFDADRNIWVRFEESTTASQGSGLGAFNYRTSYTANLVRVEPL